MMPGAGVYVGSGFDQFTAAVGRVLSGEKNDISSLIFPRSV